jgi:hypothetical protein
LIVLGTVSGGGSWESSFDSTRTTTLAAGGLLQRFGNRVGAYLALMDGRYPPFRLTL